MDNKRLLTNYVRRMTSALMNAGVKAVVISPGSRSTPLAYAFASTEDLESICKLMNVQQVILHWVWRKHPGNLSFYFVHRELLHRIIFQRLQKRIMRDSTHCYYSGPST